MLHTHGLVLFGPNFNCIKSLSTKISLAFILPNYKPKSRIGPHNSDIYSVLVGGLLGDCHADRLPSGGVRFIFKQSEVHKDYLFWLYHFFNERGYCSNNLPKKHSQKLGDKIFYFYQFNTYSYSSLLDIYKLFYIKKLKVIPNNIVELLTPLALAIWIMDDGSKVGSGLKLCTNSFTYLECLLLIKVLFDNFNVKSTIQSAGVSEQYNIYIWKESMPLLREIVLPYVHPSMKHKIVD